MRYCARDTLRYTRSLRKIKLKNSIGLLERISNFSSSIAVTVFIVKTRATKRAQWLRETKRETRREATKQLQPANTRNIVTFLFRVTFNFQAGNVSCPQPHALYTLQNGEYDMPVHPQPPLFIASMPTPLGAAGVLSNKYKQTTIGLRFCPRDG